MNLTEHDLRQLDEARLADLPESAVRLLAVKLLSDLKTLRERLNQNPKNSSRPSGSMEPWYRTATDDAESEPTEPVQPEAVADEEESSPDPDEEGSSPESESGAASNETSAEEPPDSGPKNRKTPNRKPGRQHGSQGHGRTQVLPTDREEHHYPQRCSVCDADLSNSPYSAKAYTAHYEIDLEHGESVPFGLRLVQTKHDCYHRECSCHHVTRYEPTVEAANDTWNRAISRWHLIGPRLASLLVFLAIRMRLSRARIQEFLEVWLGLKLNTGTIHQVIHEAARCVEPLEQEIIDEIMASELLHIDETPWREGEAKRWLWVVVSLTAAGYTIGGRGRATIAPILFEGLFRGWLMSDGWHIYREYANRLRCWAHWERKARGLSESLDPKAAAFGAEALKFFQWGMRVIYEARQSNPGQKSIYARYHDSHLQPFIQLCYAHHDCTHLKTRELAREIGYDEEAIFAVFDFPHLPLTHNEAERALRHWVILRRLSQGTRTAQGSRAFCLLASMVDTCRKRGASTWSLIADTIRNRRAGLPALALPPVVMVAG